jgi:hypothetical protein
MLRPVCSAFFAAIPSELSSDAGDEQMRVHKLRTFITYLLVHMHQKRKIAPLEIAAQIAVNEPLCYVSTIPDSFS